MDITFGRTKAKIQELEGEVRKLATAKGQFLIVDNILSVQEQDATYTGNRFKEYQNAVEEVSKKYQGKADWGGLQVGSIVDLRASYTVGQGIKIEKVESESEGDGEAELEFAKRFIDKNELDHELVQDLAREAEIEGKMLIKLFPIPPALDALAGAPTDIGIRWISWTTNKYTVVTNPDDYLQVERVEYQPTGKPKVVLAPDVCVYKRFAGRLDIPNETMPRVAKCLTQIENLDKALRDWREINRLYAAPTPYFKCLDATQASKINEQIKALNWKIGKAFASTADHSYVQPSSDGQAAIEAEIITLMKLISGTTGVPIHFLGAPELTTKYGAANEGLLELIAMSTAKEREIWRACYTELIGKAMKMRNAIEKKTPLDPDKIIVTIPMITQESWARLTTTWLSLYREGAIQIKTLLNQVPGLNVEEELAAKEQADAEAFEKAKEIAAGQGNQDNEDEQGGDQGNQGKGGGGLNPFAKKDKGAK
jgi:hypothetical protein